MKSTTMDLGWSESRLAGVAVRCAAPRPTVRDSLWVSLMTASRSLDSTLEDRLMGFPRRPAMRVAPQAKALPAATRSVPPRLGAADSPAEDAAFVAIGLSSFALIVYAFWHMGLMIS